MRGKMATRLERLWVLLDTGSTPVIRKAAAVQIGEIQKLHPHEFNNLLRKVSTFLSSKTWQTRIAAGQAVEAIATNVKPWEPTWSGASSEEGEESSPHDNGESELLSFATFDITQVLNHGAPLLCSTGDEYQGLENDPEFQKSTAQERLALQRQQLRQRLGLSAQGKVFSTGMEHLFDDNDLMTHTVVSPSSGTGMGPEHKKADTNIKELSALQLSGMSAREKNKAKRRARQLARRPSVDTDNLGRSECEPPPSKKPKTASVLVEQGGPSNKVLIDQVANVDSNFEESEEWPFAWFCEELFQNLFDPAWEVRHGAATALREVLKLHGQTAGLTIHTPPSERETANQNWLMDAAVRILCVFSLDRFGDFISDQVVAPVRATCAQALGIISRLMTRAHVIQMSDILLTLASEDKWEVRHASLMGIQYLLAARMDLSSVLLPSLFPTILRGIQDVDDDVRAIAAGALLPVSSDLPTLMPDKIPHLVQVLWDSLLDLDDLSSSTNSIMELMCTLLSSDPARQSLSKLDPSDPSSSSSNSAHTPGLGMELHNLVPRLWPFLSHTIGSVRVSSLNALLTLVNLRGEGGGEGEGGKGEGGGEGKESGGKIAGGGGGGVTDSGEAGNKEEGIKNEDVGKEEVKAEEGLRGEGVGGVVWLRVILQGLMCQIFQRFALEGDDKNRILLHKVWSSILSKSSPLDLNVSASPVIFAWLCLLVAPSSCPVRTNLLVPPSLGAQVSSDLYLGGNVGIESPSQKEQAAFVARVAGAKALGHLVSKISTAFRPPSPFPPSSPRPSPDPPKSDSPTPPSEATPSLPSLPETIATLSSNLQRFLADNIAIHKIIAALVVYYWNNCPLTSPLGDALLKALMDNTLLDDVIPFVNSMQKDCQLLIMAFDRKGVDVAKNVYPSGYTVEFATQLATTIYQNTIAAIPLNSSEKQEFEVASSNVKTSVGYLQEENQRLTMRVKSCLAGTIVAIACLPEKLNPLIRPLMDCVKTEADSVMQELAGSWLSQLIEMCQSRVPSPNSKITRNLCSFACGDPYHTPKVLPETGNGHHTRAPPKSKRTLGEEEVEGWRWNTGIISLDKIHSETVVSHKGPAGRGRPSAAIKEAMVTAALQEEHRKAVYFPRRGAETALVSLSRHFGAQLFTNLPHLWSYLTQPFDKLSYLDENKDITNDEVISLAQSIINSLQILEVIALSLAPPLHSQIMSLLPCLFQALHSPFTAIRHMAARGVTVLAQLDLHNTMQVVIQEIIPSLGVISSTPHRQGAIEAISHILEGVRLKVLCYVVLFLMPVMARMSDQDRDVRLMASSCFASLVTLMPLESGTATPPEMPPALAEQRQSERQFLEQLLDTRKLDNYVVPVEIKADLRKYQQDGVNWLAFLNKYNIHGILCDDMGLGKTLQTLCIIASDHHFRDKQYQASAHLEAIPLPSLVVCPPTLVGHWFYEVKKFCNNADLDTLLYSGPPNTRARLQTLVSEYKLIIASYDIIRNDIDFFKSINWNYCVLDEGHVIKNTKTKITKAIKQLRSNHRLILSGTPIQNSVLDLWSLFDFLMPGFLGTEKQFYERYTRPIVLSRDAKSSSKEQETGALAMESLHRQVLPFLLRRMKEDVLQDLPPKIIQDYYCDLSPLQAQLYEDFSKSQAQRKVKDGLTDPQEEGEEEEEGGASQVTHIFQALQYLRRVCNHPALVLTPEHPLYPKIQDYLISDSSHIKDIKHASKLLALRQLLYDCGIGDSGNGGGSGGGGEDDLAMSAAVSQHRALIFCQYKNMLDIIENDLLKVHMSSVTYLRLDGSVAPTKRFQLVNKFNSDPSVDVLLLTTHVGGLGLNLTGADTVIFFEHDWNPMKDLQAMDRAHRIGQKKVVNVYRLITKGTLEEKIMSLQKFKLNIANTVISQENSSLQSMNTSDMLDLFQVSESRDFQQSGEGEDKTVKLSKGTGVKKVLENLPELWDDSQYTNEYNLSQFMKSLTANKEKN